jgi:hypothetical protein
MAMKIEKMPWTWSCCRAMKGSFSSLRAKDTDSAILNLEGGSQASTEWGRLIFHVADVDACWKHLTDLGLAPEKPRNACWGEIFICSIRMGMSCRLRARSGSLLRAA